MKIIRQTGELTPVLEHTSYKRQYVTDMTNNRIKRDTQLILNMESVVLNWSCFGSL